MFGMEPNLSNLEMFIREFNKKNGGNEVCLADETGVPFETWKRNVFFFIMFSQASGN